MAILLQSRYRLLLQGSVDAALLEQANSAFTKRKIIVKPENRTTTVSAQNRTEVIEPQQRTVIV
jgi:hypothetical protein